MSDGINLSTSLHYALVILELSIRISCTELFALLVLSILWSTQADGYIEDKRSRNKLGKDDDRTIRKWTVNASYLLVEVRFGSVEFLVRYW